MAARSPSPAPSGISTASPGFLDDETESILPLSGDGSYCTVYNAQLLQDLVKDINAEESKHQQATGRSPGGPGGFGQQASYRSQQSGSMRGSPRGGGGVTPQHSRTLADAGSSTVLGRGIPGHQNLPTRMTTEEYLQSLADGHLVLSEVMGGYLRQSRNLSYFLRRPSSRPRGRVLPLSPQ